MLLISFPAFVNVTRSTNREISAPICGMSGCALAIPSYMFTKCTSASLFIEQKDCSIFSPRTNSVIATCHKRSSGIFFFFFFFSFLLFSFFFSSFLFSPPEKRPVRVSSGAFLSYRSHNATRTTETQQNLQFRHFDPDPQTCFHHRSLS
jgi:hypothetical protein